VARDPVVSAHAAAVAAGLLWVLALMLVGVFFGLALINGTAAPAAPVTTPVIHVAFATVGALVAWRKPGNPLGWLFCAFALLRMLHLVAVQVAGYAFMTAPGALPSGSEVALAWLAAWLLIPSLAPVPFMLFLFPDGRLLSRRWRFAAWFILAGIAVFSIADALQPGRNAEVLGPLVRVAATAIVFTAGVHMLVRFHRSRGEERQQLKWFAYATSIVLGGVVVQIFTQSGALNTPAVAALPVAAGIAILRHRLYDIDLLINRTLVYGFLSASLGGLYWGLVILLQQVLRPLTQGSELAIVGSTVAIAALFQPARSRIQAVVDRRFYRRKYDAAQTLAAFSATLRSEVDLDSLSRELLAVVRQTLQPDSACLWLRPRPGRALVEPRAPHSITRAVTIPERSPATTDSA
jgi:hypothetical protein